MMNHKPSIVLAGCAAVIVCSACHESLEQRAEREAKAFTEKYCPTPVVNNERTDSLTVDQVSRTICEWHTLSGPADNAQAIEEKKNEIITSIRDNVRASTQIKVFKDAGFNFRYIYHSTQNPNRVLLDVQFTPKDYQENKE